jgi:hypothetical protein
LNKFKINDISVESHLETSGMSNVWETGQPVRLIKVCKGFIGGGGGGGATGCVRYQDFIILADKSNKVFYLYPYFIHVTTYLGPCGPSSGEHYRFLEASY